MKELHHVTAYITVIHTMCGDAYAMCDDGLALDISMEDAEADMLDDGDEDVEQVKVYSDGTVDNQFRDWKTIAASIKDTHDIDEEQAKAEHRKFYHKHKELI